MEQRIIYIDEIKGFAILCVVIGHVLEFCLCGYQTPLYRAIYSFHMPLFAFISGYLLNINKIAMNLPLRGGGGKSWLRLLMPLIIIGPLLSIYRNESLLYFITDRDKVGLWYLWSLFVLYIIAIIYNWLMTLLKKQYAIVDLLFWVCIYILLRVLCYILEENISEILSLERTFQICAFFGLGCIARKYEWQNYLTDKYLYETMIIALFVDYYLFFKYDCFDTYSLKFLFVSFPAVYVITSLFKRYSHKNVLHNALVIMGRNSLEIYTLHYFFLGIFFFHSLGTILNYNGLLLVDSFCAITIGIIICGLSLFTSKIIKTSKVLSFLMFGILQK